LKFRNLSAAGEDYRLNLKSLAEPLSLKNEVKERVIG